MSESSESGASFGGRTRRGAGGTAGGLGQFFIGLALAGVGIYLLFDRVTVHTSFWRLGSGGSAFGVTLIPLLVGIAALFVNGKSVLGWVLTVAGLGLIVVGVVSNMDIYFQNTSLMVTLIMLGLIAAGLGLIVRSLRPQ